MVVLAFLSCGNGSYTTPNPTRMQRSLSHASGSADAVAFPSLKRVDTQMGSQKSMVMGGSLS